MSESRLVDYLDHMLEAAQQACSYVEGMVKEDFLADKRTQQAVILNIVIIGEAATKLLQNHADFLEQHTFAVEKHERHAQPRRTWLLRYQSRYGVGNRADGLAAVIGTLARNSRRRGRRRPQ